MVVGNDATQLYTNLAWHLFTMGVEEESRNGGVLTIPRPTTWCLLNPQYRCLYAPIRRPNHVFHVVEALWMLAGYNHVSKIEPFNSNIRNYTEGGVMHGAYGFRWIEHFGFDQIVTIGKRLREKPHDRQCVLTMWDPEADLVQNQFKDRPCNTHIYFRVQRDGTLDMHVLNRSNDFLWGALGSNIVHFTMLHEVVATLAECDLGRYYVTSNNLHVYLDYPNLEEVMFEAKHCPHVVEHPSPLILNDETGEQFLLDCVNFLDHDFNAEHTRCRWFRNVAEPMIDWYRNRDNRELLIGRILCPMWKAGLEQWAEKKQ